MTLNEQRLEEYCLGKKEVRTKLQPLLKFADSKGMLFEEIDIKVIKSLLKEKRTKDGFIRYLYVVKSFYKYLGCKELVEQIGEIRYENEIWFFASIAHLLEVMNNKAQNDEYLGVIADRKQYDRSKICALLYALGLNDKEIADLKQSDYSFEKSTLIVGDKKIPLIKEINVEFNRFIHTDGYSTLKKKEQYIIYTMQEYFIRMTREIAPTESAIYNLTKTIYKYFGIHLTDIKKSRKMWDLFKQQGFDLNFKNVIIKTNWEGFFLTENQKKKKHTSDEEAFIKVVSDYKDRLTWHK